MFDSTRHPHRRFNPLTGSWVLISPQRTLRPWQGQVEKTAVEVRPEYDPTCYLCPGNQRAGGVHNPAYTGTFVFDNDFPALLPDTPATDESGAGVFQTESVQGRCRVVCFSPRHDLALGRMEQEDVERVISTWGDEIRQLGQEYRWVQVFENRGAAMGASNPHPHGQIWASKHLPQEALVEDANQRSYYEANGHPLLQDVAHAEIEQGERVVYSNADWAVVVPFWAVWPFETLLLPLQPVRHLDALSPASRSSLAKALRALLQRYDRLFETPFPYSMGWHGAPPGDDPAANPHWQLHAHFYPPLLRSATVRKFMVGYEMLGEPQRDLTAEQAAERLRDFKQ